jgi:hypothetical protein
MMSAPGQALALPECSPIRGSSRRCAAYVWDRRYHRCITEHTSRAAVWRHSKMRRRMGSTQSERVAAPKERRIGSAVSAGARPCRARLGPPVNAPRCGRSPPPMTGPLACQCGPLRYRLPRRVERYLLCSVLLPSVHAAWDRPARSGNATHRWGHLCAARMAPRQGTPGRSRGLWRRDDESRRDVSRPWQRADRTCRCLHYVSGVPSWLSLRGQTRHGQGWQRTLAARAPT